MVTNEAPFIELPSNPSSGLFDTGSELLEIDVLGGSAPDAEPGNWVMPDFPQPIPRRSYALEDSKLQGVWSMSVFPMMGPQTVQALFHSPFAASAPSLRPLETAQSVSELLEAAREVRLADAAEQLEHLIPKLAHDPDADQFDKEALRRALCFLAEHRDLPDPDIGAMEDGNVDLSWSVSADGVVFVEVGVGGQFSFAMNVSDKTPGERQRINGDTSDPEIVACILRKVFSVEGGT